MGATEMTSGEAAPQADGGSCPGAGAAADSKAPAPYQARIRWLDLAVQLFLHAGFLYGFWLALTRAKLATTVWALVVVVTSGMGITAGAHRLWSHRAYKAKWPLRLLLVFLFTIAGQRHVYQWALDHRVHHKFSETDADPHNAQRGFWFAHVGWLMQRKHPEVIRRGRQVDMSDVLADPVVRFHQKYFHLQKILLCFVLPVMIPVWLWGEDWYVSFVVNAIIRYACSLNFTWLVNSAAHIWGNKPYDRRISPVENRVVALLAMGEGWHNYHHAFPWDYKAAELGAYGFNITTLWLDLFARLGMVYDRRVPSEDLVRRISEAHGDGSHPKYHRNSVTD